MTQMTEDEFNAILWQIPHDATYFATADEVTSADGSPKWAVTEERIEDPSGQVIAELQRSTPLYVDTGCPWRSGLLGGRIAADYVARWQFGPDH